MRQLFILRKEFTTEHNIPVTNRKGDIQYTIKRIGEGEKESYTILDYLNNEVLHVNSEFQDGQIKVGVWTEEKCLFTVKQTHNSLDEAYQIMDSMLDIYGDWRTLDFDINSGYRKVAKVRNRWISFGDALELTVFEKSSEVISLGILVALESICQKDYMSSR
ncbi:hypothetical protein [Vagococcus jeotgali]|uniref:hypothetical protein n=1 Tax=Vagococcus jeotgali TaxID=3109030 RepID=UPI002DDAB40E|nr:hypothetical protein [Vagococcus sp. B2T-5]